MPLLVLVIAVLLAGAVAVLAASRYPQRGGTVRAARPPRLARAWIRRRPPAWR